MLRAASGDSDAFGLLLDRHHQRALDLAMHLTGDVEWARDATHESFLRLLRAAHRYEARGSFRGYLFTVLRNVVRETARRHARRREDPLETLPESALGSAIPVGSRPPTPAEVFEARRRHDRLQAALQQLSLDLRTVFVLSAIEGLPYREIARICNCPLGTVASRKHEAVVKLRKLLEGVIE